MAVVDRRGVNLDTSDTPIAGGPYPGLAIKAPCAVATTANITLDGVQTIDGVSVGNNNERVLVWQQADQTTNGIYNASSGVWTRTVDADTNDQWGDGLLVVVTSGATYDNTVFECMTANPITLSSTEITFGINNIPATRQVATTAPLVGGGALSSNLTLSLTINGSLQVTGGALAVASLAGVAHKWVSSFNAAGQPQLTQPTVSDIANGAALSETNDTNVTLTLGGGFASALLSATSITVGWSGTLAAARLNANVVQAITNDTNVTGSITAQNLTLGWTGNLSVARGGTGAGTASGTSLDNITGFSATGFLQRTGAGTYSFVGGTGSGNVVLANSAALTGAPSAPTQTANDNSTKIATTAYLDSKLGVASGIATLDGTGKLSSAQIPAALVGALQYQGTWNASTNSPALVSSTGTKGQYYKVATAGTTTINGISQWNVGDTIVFDGTVWDKIDGTASEVISVAGRTGAVTLSVGDISGGAALTGVNDTNITLTFGGTPASALLAATSITVAWSGTLAAARLNANVVQAVTNDTNITGSITAQVLTLGWTGTLAVARGGTGAGTASGTSLDNITGFSSTGFLTRTGAGTYAFQSAANGITNANLAQGAAATLKGNPTAGTANVQDFTIQGLTDISAPSTTLDWIPIYNHTTGTIEKTNASELVAAVGGGVTNVATAGLATGGPITGTGTITVTAAVKSDQQSASSSTLAVTPLHQQDHPSAAKAWCHYQGTGTPAVLASYNVSSVTRGSTGLYTFNWTTPFASASYAAICQGNDNGSGAGSFGLLENITTSLVEFAFCNPTTLALADASQASVAAFGSQ